MISAYTLRDARLVQETGEDLSSHTLKQAVWIDLKDPSEDEEKHIEKLLEIDIPTREEMAGLELSNRLYSEDDAYFLGTMLITHADSDDPKTIPYFFVLMKERIITVRYADTQPFDVFIRKTLKRKSHAAVSPNWILMGLLEAIINRLADIIERNDRKIDELSQYIFRSQQIKVTRKGVGSSSENRLFVMMKETGIEQDILSKVKESIVNLSRLLGYSSQVEYITKHSEKERLKTMMIDISALAEHTGFVANKINFLLDALLGMITLQQNSIIKIFSVAAVVFLPPTLIASIYGMNFHHMPELDWEFGYPMAIVMMLLSAYLPYKFFKHKNWL